MNGCAFALTIALILVEHTSRGRLETSTHVKAPGVGRTVFADLGDDVMEELARDFERELDDMADDLQTVVVEAAASLADGCGSGEDRRRTLDDRELRALLEELEPSAGGEGAAVATVTAAAPTKPPIDAAARRREGTNARTRGHEKRRKRRRRTAGRTPPIQGSRSRSESSSSARRLARRRRDAAGRSATGPRSRPAALRHRSRAASKSASSAVGSLGTRGAASRRARVTTSTATDPRRTAPQGKAGENARSTSTVLQQKQQQQMRYGGVGDHRGSRGFGVAAAAAGTRDAQKRGSEESPLRRLKGVLLAAAIVAVLSITASGRRWPRPLVLMAVPLVHALVAWMANTVQNSNRDRKEHLQGAMKIAVVLASVIGVYVLTMALTQPLSSRLLREKNH